jgi:HAD superfamily hydrolase (TIGR01509 family)
MNNNIGFLFDLDGVLIDSETEYTKIWSAIDAKYPSGVADLAHVIKGQTLPYILNTYFSKEKHAAVTEMLDEMEQVMVYRMLPGADDVLAYLQQHNIPRVLVTSSNDKKMAHLREEQPYLESKFNDIVTANRISRSKPDPEGYLLGAKICNADPKNCVVIEDSVQGVTAGHRAGCLVIGLTTTVSREKLEPYSDIIVNTLADLNWDEIADTLRSR